MKIIFTTWRSGPALRAAMRTVMRAAALHAAARAASTLPQADAAPAAGCTTVD